MYFTLFQSFYLSEFIEENSKDIPWKSIKKNLLMKLDWFLEDYPIFDLFKHT